MSNIVELNPVPQDYIGGMAFVGHDQFVVACWDGSVTLYSVDENNMIADVNRITHTAGLISVAVVLDYVFVGSVEGELFFVDFENGTLVESGENSSNLGICSLCSSKAHIITGSWDGLLQVVDPYSNLVVSKHQLPKGEKILAIDGTENGMLLVGSTGKHIRLFKIDEYGQLNQTSNLDFRLKFQIRDIKIAPDFQSYAYGGIDGRVAVEYFENPTQTYAFRCHYLNLEDAQITYPVNSICFAPNTNTLYTSGSDGLVSLWDLSIRKRIQQFPRFNNNAVVKLICNGRILLVATSDDSFKTNAVNDEVELANSQIYLVRL
ncbi:hypothetical protein TBLA_0E03320 [Henningerozyma blattae CBS 6284]|uniref:Uncharacterized protein n=1 Tax=Henningerozyma blattae (strain ATCC 34711 / CBS 6284 / DSM 70876 / NBRC 10599 / NRRL Y-10934 / UCD 77-7) TaxID=1071380 RepID=I2H4T4_HENB6|nr:hypothetical protein TBLA_0E03320 [Tetrapisispora blattae CBS 6284]CCH61386.1 hypothetical protein TBLA_0E03320 [Tetrapisispora blattae CBS 6284]